MLTRPISALKSANSSSPPSHGLTAPLSYSPPFSLSSTPPFALPHLYGRHAAVPQGISPLPRPNSTPGTYHQAAQDAAARFGSSPAGVHTGALARALTNTAMRFIGSSANSAATVIARATARRRPIIARSALVDPAEEQLLSELEDLAQKAFVLFDFADSRLAMSIGPSRGGGHELGTPPLNAQAFVIHAGTSAADAARKRRASSGSTSSSEVLALRQQEAAAAEAMVLYLKALAFLQAGMEIAKRFWSVKAGQDDQFETTAELNDSE